MLGKNPSEAAAAALVVMECDILRARGPSAEEIAEAERQEAERKKAEAEAKERAEEEARLEKRRLQDEEIARQNEKLRIDKEKLAAQELERVAAQKRAAEEAVRQPQVSYTQDDYRDMVNEAYGINPQPAPLPEEKLEVKVQAPPKPQGLVDQVVEKGKAIVNAGGDLIIEGMEGMVNAKRMGHRRRNSDTPRVEGPLNNAVKKVEAFFGPDPEYVRPQRAAGQDKLSYFMELYKEINPNQYNALFNGQGGLLQHAPLFDAVENGGIALGFLAHEGGGYARRFLRDDCGVDPGVAQNWGDLAKLWINLGMPYAGAAAGRVAGLAGRAARAAGGAGQKLMGKGANLLAPVAPEGCQMNRGLLALDLEVRAFPQGNKIQGPKAEFKMDLQPQGKQVMPKNDPPVLKKDLGAKPQAPNEVPVHGEPKAIKKEPKPNDPPKEFPDFDIKQDYYRGHEGYDKVVPRDPYAGNPVRAKVYNAELALREKGVLDAHGRITPEAAQGATHIPLGDKPIGNPQVIKILTSDGSHINDWGKFKIESIKLSSGEGVQLHFYKNLKTGVVDYVTKDIRITKVIE